MPRMWSSPAADQFWSTRELAFVSTDNCNSHVTAEFQAELNERANRGEQEYQQFTAKYAKMLSNSVIPHSEENTSVAEDLTFWAIQRSWTFCNECGSVDRLKLMPTYQSKGLIKHKNDCQCKNIRYIVPCLENIPECLHGLSHNDILSLRPVDLHVGEYKRLKHGYRQKTNMCRVTWSKDSPEDKILQITDANSRAKVNAVYTFLMSFQESAYSQFVRKRQQCIGTERKLNMYISEYSQGIECALWPHLYPKKSWCETTITGNNSRLSTKVAFFIKVFSSVVDYGIDFELLQFHYDLWLFKTVSGAIFSARRLHCSPVRALNAKTFSPGYWKTQHRLLQDAVDQFGYPSLFLTISPYKWTFPMASWIENIRNKTGKCPTHLAAYETIHIAHTLEQVIHGYLCGSNSNKWSKHAFSYQNKKGRSNINTYFYRFEFQKRGTVHVHLLVWLKNMKKIQHQLIRADIPWEDPKLAFLVHKLQQSDKGALEHNEASTRFVDHNGNCVLHLYHPKEAFAINLHCYLSTVLPTLRCRMDFQFTNGNDMLLRYVCSYVSKWQDAYSNERLFSKQTSPYQAAYRHIKDTNICEPEMWLYMSSMKMSWTSSRSKQFSPPKNEELCQSETYTKYLRRDQNAEHLSFLEWLRAYQHTCATPRPYKHGNTLVSVQYTTPFHDEFFFQDLFMNHAHTNLPTLFLENYKDYPEQFRYFACAVVKRRSQWASIDTARVHFEKLGHRDYYIDNLLYHIASLHNMLNLWHRGILNRTNFIQSCTEITIHTLDSHQTAIFNQIVQAMNDRNEHYSAMDQFGENSDDDDDIGDQDEDMDCTEDNEQEAEETTSIQPSAFIPIDWKKIFLITGEAGTGKSQIVLRSIEWALDNDLKVLVATPTALLAIRYENAFDKTITSETIHSTFLYPVQSGTQPKINWSLSILFSLMKSQ